MLYKAEKQGITVWSCFLMQNLPKTPASPKAHYHMFSMPKMMGCSRLSVSVPTMILGCGNDFRCNLLGDIGGGLFCVISSVERTMGSQWSSPWRDHEWARSHNSLPMWRNGHDGETVVKERRVFRASPVWREAASNSQAESAEHMLKAWRITMGSTSRWR